MKYKYVGTTTAVILVGDSLKNIQPGDIVDVPVVQGPHFAEISPPKAAPVKEISPPKAAPVKESKRNNQKRDS